MKVKARLEHKINVTLPALLPNKMYRIPEGQRHLVTKLDMKNRALETRELYHY